MHLRLASFFKRFIPIDTKLRVIEKRVFADLEANYLTAELAQTTFVKKEDVIPPSESQFDTVNGYPEYYVKNEHVSTRIDNSLTMADFNILTISLPPEVKDQIFKAPDDVNIFKFILRKKKFIQYRLKTLDGILWISQKW